MRQRIVGHVDDVAAAGGVESRAHARRPAGLDGHPRSLRHRPHGWTTTVPSGCSQVIVPLDVMVGCAGVPLLPICIDIISVQSYRARPGVPAVSNRRPPVMRVVEVTLDGVPPVAVPNV